MTGAKIQVQVKRQPRKPREDDRDAPTTDKKLAAKWGLS